MKMLLKGGVMAVCALTAFGAMAEQTVQPDTPIASISQPKGTVLINQGREYVGARAGQKLRAGDRIMTMDKSQVSVVYKNGCVDQLEANTRLTLRSEDECVAKLAQKSGGQKAAGGTAAAAALAQGGSGAALFGGGLGTFAVVGGGIVAGAVVVNNNNDNGASAN